MLSRELRVQVPEIRIRVEIRAGDASQELPRRVSAAVPVDVLAEPFSERRELSPGELLVQVAQIFPGTVPDLNGDDVAELVRREVPEEPDRPVHVLQHTVSIVRNVDAEVVLHASVPDLGQLTHFDGSGQELLLELEPQDDVQTVRDLVRVTANQPRTDRAHGTDEGRLVDPAQRGGKDRLELRVEPAPEPRA